MRITLLSRYVQVDNPIGNHVTRQGLGNVNIGSMLTASCMSDFSFDLRLVDSAADQYPGLLLPRDIRIYNGTTVRGLSRESRMGVEAETIGRMSHSIAFVRFYEETYTFVLLSNVYGCSV